MDIKTYIQTIKNNIDFYSKKELKDILNNIQKTEFTTNLAKDYLVVELKKLIAKK